jgi:hypothetical protein
MDDQDGRAKWHRPSAVEAGTNAKFQSMDIRMLLFYTVCRMLAVCFRNIKHIFA